MCERVRTKAPKTQVTPPRCPARVARGFWVLERLRVGGVNRRIGLSRHPIPGVWALNGLRSPGLLLPRRDQADRGRAWLGLRRDGGGMSFDWPTSSGRAGQAVSVLGHGDRRITIEAQHSRLAAQAADHVFVGGQPGVVGGGLAAWAGRAARRQPDHKRRRPEH